MPSVTARAPALASEVSPYIIRALCNKCCDDVNDGHYATLRIVDAEGFRVAKAHHGRFALRIAEEVQVVAALRHVDDVLAIERVDGHHVVYDLLDFQAVVTGLLNANGKSRCYLLRT